MAAQYQQGDEKRHFSLILAALIVIALAVGGFIYTLFNVNTEEEFQAVFVEEVGGEIHVNPGNMRGPSGPPSVPAPSIPPPN